MSQFFRIHPETPQARLIQQAVGVIRSGAVVVYPTDSAYALGCHIGDKAALDRICRIRNLDAKHSFTLICRDLSEVGKFATFDTPVFRLLRANTPDAYTFILRATQEVPRRLMHPKRKTIGVRIPNHSITQALLAELNEPMLTTTLILPGRDQPMTDPAEIRNRLEQEVDLVIDGGFGGLVPTTMIDFIEGVPRVLREGKGNVTPFL